MAKNIIQIAPEKFPWLDVSRYAISMGVEKDGMVYVAGQTASTYYKDEGHVRCKGDIVEQTKVAWEKIGVVLEATGLSYSNIVRTVDYINPQGLAKYRHTGEVRRQYLANTPTAATGICVYSLLRPDALIEINAIAVKGEKEAVYPEGPEYQRYERLTYDPGVKVGNKVWLSGLTGGEQDEAGGRTFSEDTAQQVANAYKGLDKVLTKAGAASTDVIYSTDYIVPEAYLRYRDTAKVRQAYYRGTYPAAVGIVVNRLLPPEGHVEVELTGVIGAHREEIRIPAWEQGYGESTNVPALKMGNLVYFSGQAAVNHTTGQGITAQDVVAQARKAYQNIAELCAAAGISMDDIVYTLEFMPPNGIEGYRGVAQVRREFFGDRFPAATGIIMQKLLRPEMLFEVVAVAVV